MIIRAGVESSLSYPHLGETSTFEIVSRGIIVVHIFVVELKGFSRMEFALIPLHTLLFAKINFPLTNVLMAIYTFVIDVDKIDDLCFT